MTTVLDMAILAADAYKPTVTPAATMRAWKRVDFEPARDYLNGFQAAAFEGFGLKVIAFRGTAVAIDAVADIKLGAGMNDQYFSQGEAFAEKNLLRGRTLVTGPSLGGAIAQIVANRLELPMVTFNAPGVAVLASRNFGSSSTLMNAVRVGGLAASMLRHPMQAFRDVRSAFNFVRGLNVCLENDIISKVGLHYGEVARIRGASANPLTEHKIATVIEVLASDRLGARAISAFF